MYPPLAQISSFSCSFREDWPNNRLTPLRGWRPPSGKSWSPPLDPRTVPLNLRMRPRIFHAPPPKEYETHRIMSMSLFRFFVLRLTQVNLFGWAPRIFLDPYKSSSRIVADPGYLRGGANLFGFLTIGKCDRSVRSDRNRIQFLRIITIQDLNVIEI